jgi:hypothetical protein
MKMKSMLVLGVAALALTLVLTTITPAANNSTGSALPGASAQPFAAEASPAERHPISGPPCMNFVRLEEN